MKNCPVCQNEKSDHTLAKGKLMSTKSQKRNGVNICIDFVTDLLPSANEHNAILVTIDKATRMVHLATCTKNIIETRTIQLLRNTVIRYHSISRAIYSDRGAQVAARSWQEL